MANQHRNVSKKQQNKDKHGSGSQYHDEKASHLPDYGGNIKDPNANQE